MKSGRLMIGLIRLIGPVALPLAAWACIGSSAATSSKAISALALNPACTRIAVGGFRSVTLRPLESGTPALKTLQGCPGGVNALAYSADGKLLAAAGGLTGRSGEVDVWTVATGKLLARLKGPVDVVQSIAWRPGKREIVGGSYDKNVYIWRLPAPGAKPQEIRPYRSLRDHTDAVYGVDFNSDGSRIASASGDRTVKIWDVGTGKRLITLSQSTGELYSVAFRPGGLQVAAGGADRIIRVWNSATGDLIKSAFAHDGPILRMLYTRDGMSLISCAQDRAVKQWNAETMVEAHVFPRQTEWPQALAVNGDRIVVGCQDGRLSQYLLESAPSSGVSDVEIHHRDKGGITHIGRISPIGLMVPIRARVAPAPDPIVNRVPGNSSLDHAQMVSVPVTISGELWEGKAAAEPVWDALSHYYRFTAHRGAPLVIDVMARRAGSALDSYIQILDSTGAPVEQAVLRAVGQSEITLFDKDSAITGIRLLPFPDLHLNDYVLIGRELLRVGALPKGPDDDTQFRSIHGQRVGYLGTNPEYHSIGTKVYRVEIHPAGSKFSPNGMPLTHLIYENDDGGPLYGRDSYLMFTPPSDGDYIVRLSDSREIQGKGFSYKLNIHPPRPDYKISFSPATVTVPKGGREAVTVECERFEGIAGPVHVKLEDLPAGFSATESDIEAGENSATLLITDESAPAVVTASSAKASVSFRVVARAEINGQPVERILASDPAARKLVIGAAPGVQADIDTLDVALKPGGEAAIVATIVRAKGFAGRVPIDVRNLPFGVKVMDVGLNGILVTEKETTRRIVLSCESWVSPQDRVIYLFAGVEGGVGTGAPPIMLHIGRGGSR